MKNYIPTFEQYLNEKKRSGEDYVALHLKKKNHKEGFVVSKPRPKEHIENNLDVYEPSAKQSSEYELVIMTVQDAKKIPYLVGKEYLNESNNANVNESQKPKRRKGAQTKIDPELFDAIVPIFKNHMGYGDKHPKEWTADNFADFMRDRDYRGDELLITLFDEPVDSLLRAIFPKGYGRGELTGANKDKYSKFVLSQETWPYSYATPLYDLWAQILADTFGDQRELKALDALIKRNS